MSYNRCLKLLQNLHTVNIGSRTTSHDQLPFHNVVAKLSHLFEIDSLNDSQQFPGLFVKILHSLSMLSRRAPIMPGFAAENKPEILSSGVENNCKSYSQSPIVFALSHSNQSVQFHRKNGFCPIVERSYETLDSANGIAFIVQAMVMRISDKPATSQTPRIIPCLTAHTKHHELAHVNGIPLTEFMQEDKSIDNSVVSTV